MNTSKPPKQTVQDLKGQIATLFSPPDYSNTPFQDLPPPLFYPSFTSSIPKPKINRLVKSVESVENNFLENEFVEDPVTHSQNYTAAVKDVSDNLDSLYVSHAQSFRSIVQVLNEGTLRHLPFSIGPYDSKTDVLDAEGETGQIQAASFSSSSTIQSQNDDVTVQVSELKEIEDSGKVIPMVEVEVRTSTTLPSSSNSGLPKNAPELNVSHLVLRRDRYKERKTEIDNYIEEEEYEKERDQKKREKEKEKLKYDLENSNSVAAVPRYYASQIEEKEKLRNAANPPNYQPFLPSSYRTLQYLQYANFALLSPQEIFQQIEENNKVRGKEIMGINASAAGTGAGSSSLLPNASHN